MTEQSKGPVTHREDTDLISANIAKIGKEEPDYFMMKGEFEDEVTLKFDDGKEFYVPADFLKMASPIFQRMLNSGFKENRTRIIELKDKDSTDFLELLTFMHPAIPKRVTEDTVFQILPLAEEYDIKSAIAACKAALTSILTTAEQFQNCLSREDNMYINVDHNKQSKVLSKCFEILHFALTFAHSDMEIKAITAIAKFPSWMYTEKSNQPILFLYSGCYAHYCSLPEASRVRLLERRLRECEIRQMGGPYDSLAKRNTGTNNYP